MFKVKPIQRPDEDEACLLVVVNGVMYERIQRLGLSSITDADQLIASNV